MEIPIRVGGRSGYPVMCRMPGARVQLRDLVPAEPPVLHRARSVRRFSVTQRLLREWIGHRERAEFDHADTRERAPPVGGHVVLVLPHAALPSLRPCCKTLRFASAIRRSLQWFAFLGCFGPACPESTTVPGKRRGEGPACGHSPRRATVGRSPVPGARSVNGGDPPPATPRRSNPPVRQCGLDLLRCPSRPRPRRQTSSPGTRRFLHARPLGQDPTPCSHRKAPGRWRTRHH